MLWSFYLEVYKSSKLLIGCQANIIVMLNVEFEKILQCKESQLKIGCVDKINLRESHSLKDLE